MNSGIVQANAVLALGAIVVLWVYLLRTNIKRVYRIPLGGIGLLAGYVLFVINDKLVTHAHLTESARWWCENSGLLVMAMALGALPFASHWQAQHVKREGATARKRRVMGGSHGSMNVQR